MYLKFASFYPGFCLVNFVGKFTASLHKSTPFVSMEVQITLSGSSVCVQRSFFMSLVCSRSIVCI
jgi:hypothetical protein